ncbi:MAG: ROK family protein [Eubacteriales bacterium]
MDKYYIGIDIGGTAVKIGLVNCNGTLLATSTASVNFDHYQTPIIDTVLKETDNFLNDNKISLTDIHGIGVSATGQVNTHNGCITGTAGHIANWLDTPISQILSQHYQKPVTVANDANCAAFGEKWMGAAKSHSNVIMITIGTGVGGGIIVNNTILSGSIGIAGELGHFSIKKDGIPCSCGNVGCLEQYASTTALVRRVRESNFVATSNVLPQDINGKYIFQQVAKGNLELQDLLDDWIADIAVGITGLVHIFNPSLIVVGGGVSHQEDLFIKPLSEKIYSSVMPSFSKDLTICSAQLGNNAGILGAVANHLSSL